MRYIILGTAGHIDHGKSSLVKALTGIDPDRLKEEKERGITIDIGFADLLYPESDLAVGIVDVPGHEKLIKNMLAGAGGIDIVLMVIAADEGVMPQSREHLAICNILKIQSGLIAVTKTDLVEKDWLLLVQEEIREFVKGTFLEKSPMIPVSSRTGENLEALKEEIRRMALVITPKRSKGLFRLPIDRVFTLKGFGTVVTGTAISGKVSLEDALEILPKGIKTKVRGLHSHGKSLSSAYAGQRVAINLQGIEKEDIERGDVAVTPSTLLPTRTIDAFVELLRDAPPLKSKGLVHFYSGTAETIARMVLFERDELKGGESSYCQLRLQDPVVVMSGDHYIIRRFSPLETLGGGEILDPSPVRRRRKEGVGDLTVFHTGSLDERLSKKIEREGAKGISLNALRGWINAEPDLISSSIGRLKDAEEILRHEGMLLHRKAFLALKGRMVELLRGFHEKNPLKPGMPKEEVRNQLKIEPGLFNFIVSASGDMVADKDLLRLGDFRIALSSGEEAYKKEIVEALEKGRFQPPSREELSSSLHIEQKRLSDILAILTKEGSVVRINESLYLTGDSYGKMISLLKEFFSRKSEMTLAEFRDILNTTRKYALPFIEYLDSHKVTIRTGDVRKLLLKG